MGFIGVYTALYDYQPQAQGELELQEGDLLCILEKSPEDDWWKAKKKADRDEEDEPEGLVPNNYVEEVRSQFLCSLSFEVVYRRFLCNSSFLSHGKVPEHRPTFQGLTEMR